MLVTDLEKYREKVWLGISDVMKLTELGYPRAKLVIKEVNNLRKQENLYIPDQKKVLAKDLFRYMGL